MIRDTIEANWKQEVDFLKALVRAPSDNPPGDCAAAAEVAAQELQALGFSVERHRVPEALVHAQRHEERDQPDRAEDVRQRARGR